MAGKVLTNYAQVISKLYDLGYSYRDVHKMGKKERISVVSKAGYTYDTGWSAGNQKVTDTIPTGAKTYNLDTKQATYGTTTTTKSREVPTPPSLSAPSSTTPTVIPTTKTAVQNPVSQPYISNWNTAMSVGRGEIKSDNAYVVGGELVIGSSKAAEAVGNIQAEKQQKKNIQLPQQKAVEPKPSFQKAVESYEQRHENTQKMWSGYDAAVSRSITLGGAIAPPEQRSKWSPVRWSQEIFSGLYQTPKLATTFVPETTEKIYLMGRGFVAEPKTTSQDVFFTTPKKVGKDVYLNPSTYVAAAVFAAPSVISVKAESITTTTKTGSFSEPVKVQPIEAGGFMKAGAMPVTDVPMQPKAQTLGLSFGVVNKVSGKGVSLVGKGAKGWQLGTPEVDFTKLNEPFSPEGTLQTKMVLKNFPAQGEGVTGQQMKANYDIEAITQKTKSKFVKDEFSRNIETLPPKGVDIAINFAKKNKGEIYGTFGAEPQQAPGLGRTPADIDIFVKAKSANLLPKVENLVKDLRKQGINAKNEGLLVIAKNKGIERHAIDIHAIDSNIDAVGVPGARTYGFPLNQKTIKIEEVNTMPLSEQGLRKGASIMTVRKTPEGKLTIAPEAHRMKDIGDFFNTQETLLRSRGSKPSEMVKFEKAKGLYPEEFTKPQGRSTVELWSPKKSPSMAGSMFTSAVIPSGGYSTSLSSSKSQNKMSDLNKIISPSKKSSPISVPKLPSIGLSPSSPSKKPSSMMPAIPKSPSVSLPIKTSIPSSPTISKTPSPFKSSIPKSPSLPSFPISPSPSVSPSIYKYPSAMPEPPASPPFGLGLPIVMGGGRGGKPSDKTWAGRNFQYMPDLKSVLFNIKGKGKAPTGKMTGLESRPIYSGGSAEKAVKKMLGTTKRRKTKRRRKK